MNIQSVNRKPNGNRYCGPAVISALTKLDTDEAARLIRSVGKRASIKGTTSFEIIRSLELCGITVAETERFPRNDRPTLAQWLKTHKTQRTAGRVFLIDAGNHWQLVSGRRFVCGITNEVVSVTHDKVRRRSRVACVRELVAENILTPAAALAPVKTEQQKRQIRQTALARAKCKALAAQYGIEIEEDKGIEHRAFWIGQPEWLEGDDPVEDGHYVYEWEDALELVEIYAKHHPSHPDHANRKFNVIGPCA